MSARQNFIFLLISIFILSFLSCATVGDNAPIFEEENFYNENDSILYLYRVPNLVGSLVKFSIIVFEADEFPEEFLNIFRGVRVAQWLDAIESVTGTYDGTNINIEGINERLPSIMEANNIHVRGSLLSQRGYISIHLNPSKVYFIFSGEMFFVKCNSGDITFMRWDGVLPTCSSINNNSYIYRVPSIGNLIKHYNIFMQFNNENNLIINNSGSEMYEEIRNMKRISSFNFW